VIAGAALGRYHQGSVTLRRMRYWPVGLALWLLVLAGVELALLVAVWEYFVRSAHGQLLDTVALSANSIGRTSVQSLVENILNAMSVLSLGIATAAVGFIALIRRRIAVAVGAVLLIAGANATALLLKSGLHRPELGIDVQRAGAGNSFPSGHTTVAASVAVALILVLPPGVRGVAAVLGALFASVAGVATLSAGWHRPSDAIGSLLLVGVWASVAGLFIIAAQHSHGGVEYGPPHRRTLLILAIAGLALLGGAWIGLGLTDHALPSRADEVGRHRLMVAYAGAAMGITGIASLLCGSVLATVHRVVPRVVAPPPTRRRRPAKAAANSKAGD
jgi:membrane-associated phospholipid phosphatase